MKSIAVFPKSRGKCSSLKSPGERSKNAQGISRTNHVSLTATFRNAGNAAASSNILSKSAAQAVQSHSGPFRVPKKLILMCTSSTSRTFFAEIFLSSWLISSRMESPSSSLKSPSISKIKHLSLGRGLAARPEPIQTGHALRRRTIPLFRIQTRRSYIRLTTYPEFFETRRFLQKFARLYNFELGTDFEGGISEAVKLDD